MLKIANGFLVVLVLISGALLYAMEHKTRGLERDIARTESAINEADEDIKLLSAEWSSLTRPERIQLLAAKGLSLAPAKAEQFVTLEQLPSRMDEMRAAAAGSEKPDAIGDLLKKMQ